MTRSATVRDLHPLLLVANMERSLAFYRDKLGFRLVHSWSPEGRIAWCHVERGGAGLMLQQACEEDGDPQGWGRGIVFYFQADDADALHAEFTANGLTLAPPAIAFYGMKQVFLRDPDGYELCFQNPVPSAANSPCLP
jgi:lactoylglutathione lyase